MRKAAGVQNCTGASGRWWAWWIEMRFVGSAKGGTCTDHWPTPDDSRGCCRVGSAHTEFQLAKVMSTPVSAVGSSCEPYCFSEESSAEAGHLGAEDARRERQPLLLSAGAGRWFCRCARVLATPLKVVLTATFQLLSLTGRKFTVRAWSIKPSDAVIVRYDRDSRIFTLSATPRGDGLATFLLTIEVVDSSGGCQAITEAFQYESVGAIEVGD